MRRYLLSAAVSALLVISLSARADVTTASIAFAPYGDPLRGASGAIVPLTSTSLLVTAEGLNHTRGTADDVVLWVTDIDGVPTVASLLVPFQCLPNGSSPTMSGGARMARLSATRAVVPTAGGDGTWATADDTVYFLVEIGTTNTVYPVTIPRMSGGGACSPVPVSDWGFLVVTTGADGLRLTADDVVTYSRWFPGFVQTFDLPAPKLDDSGGTKPVPLTMTSFLVVSPGPDGAPNAPDNGFGTADDLTYLFTDLEGGRTRIDVPTPHLLYGTPGQPVRVDGETAVVSSAGPDGDATTADDRIYLLRNLTGATPSVTAIPVPHIFDYAAGQPLFVRPGLIVVATAGPDGIDGTADDALVFVSDLGGANAVNTVTVGPLDEDGECRPVLLGPDRLVVPTMKHDPDVTESGLAFVTGLGTTNDVQWVEVAGMLGGVTSIPLPLSPAAVLVSTGGPDGAYGGGDDVVKLVTLTDAGPQIGTISPGGDFDNSYQLAYAPALLGGGRAALVSAGPDGSLIDGGDGNVRVIDGLPAGRRLAVAKLKASYDPADQAKGEKFSLSGTLLLDLPDRFGTGALRISVGCATETIPPEMLVHKGSKWSYKRAKGAPGLISKLSWDSVKGKLTIAGNGVGTGIERTEASHFPVAVESGEVYLGEELECAVGKKGVSYSAPR